MLQLILEAAVDVLIFTQLKKIREKITFTANQREVIPTK